MRPQTASGTKWPHRLHCFQNSSSSTTQVKFPILQLLQVPHFYTTQVRVQPRDYKQHTLLNQLLRQFIIVKLGYKCQKVSSSKPCADLFSAASYQYRLINRSFLKFKMYNLLHTSPDTGMPGCYGHCLWFYSVTLRSAFIYGLCILNMQQLYLPNTRFRIININLIKT